MGLREHVDNAVAHIRSKSDFVPRVALVLGSGLGPLAEALEHVVLDLSTNDIPGWPASTVDGHAGRLMLGGSSGCPVMLMQGRAHAYEGYDLGEVTLPIRVAAKLGAEILILTNSAGGIAPEVAPGDIMLIEDHLHLQGQSPLEGPNESSWGPRFPDLSEVYDAELRATAEEAAASLDITLQHGVYASLRGPQYETPAEVRMLAGLGADAVGMSTTPEAIVARHMGVRVLGFSVISNAAAGIASHTLSHDEVVETGERVGERLTPLVIDVLRRLSEG